MKAVLRVAGAMAVEFIGFILFFNGFDDSPRANRVVQIAVVIVALFGTLGFLLSSEWPIWSMLIPMLILASMYGILKAIDRD